jgi:hypothetical protein
MRLPAKGAPPAGGPGTVRTKKPLEWLWPARPERPAMAGASSMTALQQCAGSMTDELLVPLRSDGQMGR